MEGEREGQKEGGIERGREELVHFGSVQRYSPPRQGRDSSRNIRPHRVHNQKAERHQSRWLGSSSPFPFLFRLRSFPTC